MDHIKLVAALLETANELDTLNLGAEANTVTRIASEIANGKRIANLPTQTTNRGDKFNEDWPWSPHEDMDRVLNEAFPEQEKIGYGGYSATMQKQQEDKARQDKMRKLVDKIRAISNIAFELRQDYGNLDSEEQADEAEEMVAELETELQNLYIESQQAEELDSDYADADDYGDETEEDPFNGNLPVGEANMDSEPLFQGQQRVPYSDELAGGPGARLFS